MNRLFGTEIALDGSIVDIELILRECLDCGLEFFAPTVVASSAFYELLGASNYYASSRWDHAEVLGSLVAGQRLLDVGAGAGSFALLASKRGAQVSELDFVDLSCGVAHTDGNRWRVDLSNTEQVESLVRDLGENFDVITLFHVLEHVVRPVELLRSLVPLLRSGGSLYVSVPNRERFDISVVQVLDCPPHHQTRWAQGQLHRLGEELGVRDSNVRTQWRFNPRATVLGPVRWSWDQFRLRPQLPGDVGRPWPLSRLYRDQSLLARFEF